MPKRTDISTILIIGAGPIVIGQACEFDYSGTQAVKTLKEEGYRIVLVNSNPATIMTDPELADATYIEPITPEIVAKIIEKARHVIPGGFALMALSESGLPAIIRPSFTMGGTGGGIAYNKEEFLDIIERGLDASPTNEVLIEESVLGWKEFEMEVVRDKKDNCIIVCSIENLDPMGVHTGDS